MSTEKEGMHEPDEPSGCGMVLTHGAGGNSRSPLLVGVAEALCAAGVTVMRYDLPFRQKRPFGPPSPAGAAADRAGLREMARKMRGKVRGPVLLAGQSYGGRQASMLAAEAEPGLIDGLMLLSYPLHPPGKPAQLRTAHFGAIRVPVLFVHGTKDPFGSADEIRTVLVLISSRVELALVEGAGHDLRKGKGIGAICLEGLAELGLM